MRIKPLSCDFFGILKLIFLILIIFQAEAKDNAPPPTDQLRVEKFLSVTTIDIKDAQIRLSDWLINHPLAADDYPLGTMWMTPEELKIQRLKYKTLIRNLNRFSNAHPESNDAITKIRKILDQLQPTGRVNIAGVSARWLEANPLKNPVLMAGDQLLIPKRPQTIRVITDQGKICEIPHASDLFVRDYIKACLEDRIVTWSWLVEPDGRVKKIGQSMWNVSVQDQPAPGAWIWAPSTNSWSDDSFSEKWAYWLSTQGISSRYDLDNFEFFIRQVKPEPRPTLLEAIVDRNFSPKVSASDFGNVGLMQTPSARMRPTGSFSTNLQSTRPYVNWNNFFQPFDWLETGFRYTKIGNRDYYTGSPEITSGQGYADKSIDFKLRGLKESDYLPELAVGVRDMAGTGLFSSEYVVSSKRVDRLDFSAGIAWGYLGSRGDLTAPLGSKFSIRPSSISNGPQGGNFSTSSYFHGPAAFFGGIQYDSPWNATFKLEYDGNNYKNEPLTESTFIRQKSPINFGATYHLASFIDFSLGIERGNTLSVGITMATDLSSLSIPKISDKATPALNISRPKNEPDWDKTAKDIHDLTEWKVDQIYEENNKVIVEASFSDAPYKRVRLDKAMSVINRDAPEQINTVEIEHKNANQVIAVEKINREKWLISQTEPARSDKNLEPVAISYDIVPPTSKGLLTSSVGPKIDLNPDLDFIYNWQSANGFLLYELDASENLNITLPYNFYIKGKERARITDNYKNWVVDPWSLLPHVRSDGRLYKTSKEFTMTNLSLIQANHFHKDWYSAAYVGYFEEEFGGIGGEVMYRPGGSSFAASIDMNHVKQREYDQNFNFLNYQVNTGHLNLYWRTPVDGVLMQINYGQFLAADRGTRYSLRKEFPNGVSMSAYITKTNVPAALFGEGTFDKGLEFSIPFDAFLTSSSHTWATFFWKPLTKDGGQMVIRPINLYLDTSSWANPYNSFFKQAPLANEEVAPDDRVDKNFR